MAKDNFFTEQAEKEISVEKVEIVKEGEQSSQLPYFSASNVCSTMDTVVPRSMAIEQKKFNERLKAACAEMGMSVEQYVAKKLHYRSVDDLCSGVTNNVEITTETGETKIVNIYTQKNWKELLPKRIVAPRFSAEQIDAIAAVIWNYETSDNGIIIADQTGQGKGRIGAGILRYAILELKNEDKITPKIPFFFTEKKHLINDIFRDLVAIGFDAGIPQEFAVKEVIENTEFTDAQLTKIIKKDIESTDDITVEFEIPEKYQLDENKIIKLAPDADADRARKATEEEESEIEQLIADLIQAYRQHFLENGFEKQGFEENYNYSEQVRQAGREGFYTVTPFCPNKIDVKDIDGNILYKKLSDNELKKITKKDLKNATIEDFILPAQYKMFALTYSQISRGFEGKDEGRKKLNKIKLFEKFSKGSILVLDEAHNAAGVSSKGELTNTGEILFPMIKSSKLTTYISATFAKRPDNMPLYALKTSIRESGLSDKDMIEVFSDGGNALQEAVSAELTRNGQLLRREKLIQGHSFYEFAKEGESLGDEQIIKLNRVAEQYKEVLQFGDKVSAVIGNYLKTLTDDEKEKTKKARSVNALTFQMFNFFLLCLKTKQTVDLAVNGKVNEDGTFTGGLIHGRKTVITVSSTMESALDNLSKTFLSNDEADAYKIGDKIKNDFNLYMAYLLNYTMRYIQVDVKISPEGKEEEVNKTIQILNSGDELSTIVKDALLREYERILKSILENPTGVPIAPIDMIERAIKKNGFSVGEITGRSRKIVFEENTEYGVIAKREIKKTEAVVRQFNENELDCLIINQSGATGISMHAIPNKKVDIVYQPSINSTGELVENAPLTLENKKEVKKRAMIVTQMDLDINKEVQKLGRINRLGQVYQPEYIYTVSAIPSEARLTALMEKKLRSLSANVSSNQEQSSHLFSSDDFFSETAAEPFNEAVQDIGGSFKAPISRQAPQAIQNFTKTLYFTDFNKQKLFYESFSKRLSEHIAKEKELGIYKGSMSFKEYYAETISEHPFYIGDNDAKTSFGRHSLIQKCTVKLFKERYTEDKIKSEIANRMIIKEGNDDDLDGKKTLYFTDFENYKAKCFEILDALKIQKKDLNDKLIESEIQDGLGFQKQIDEANAKLSQFVELKNALDLETSLKETEKLISETKQKISDALNENNMDFVMSETPKLTELNAEQKKKAEALKPFEEVLKQKGEHKTLLREIKDATERLEKTNRWASEYAEKTETFFNLIEKTKTYLSQIGTIQEVGIFQPIIKHEEKGAVFYEPNMQSLKNYVLTGVSFPKQHSNFVPSSVDVHFTGATEKLSYTLSALEPKKNYEATVKVTDVGSFYKDVWNKIVGKEDASYTETRFMITGSILKTFSLAKNNKTPGQITKYNTIDNKVKIGIEIADNNIENKSRGIVDQKSVYRILDERYGDSTNLQYPIYIDGSTKNIHRFIEQYIYFYLFGEVLEKSEKNISASESTFQPVLNQYTPLQFVFQISSSSTSTYFVFKLPDSVRDKAILAAKAYNNGGFELVKENILDEGQVFSSITCLIVSDTVLAGDFFAAHYAHSLAKDVNFTNYTIVGKSKNFPNAATERSPTVLRVNRGEQFKTFFPTDLTKMEEFLTSGFKYFSELKMSFDDFISLMKYFEKRRMKPMLSTASDYFNKFKGEYVFEQFIDEEAEDNSKKLLSNDEFNISFESEVNALIDELVKVLSNEV